MAHDRNNTLEDYRQLAGAAENTPLCLDADGRLRSKTRQDKLDEFVKGSGPSHNERVLLDFKSVLAAECGPEIAQGVFEAAGLNECLQQRQPLTPQAVAAVIRDADLAVVAAIRNRDDAHRAGYVAREQAAMQWTPATQASTLLEANYPGLRCHHSDQGNMRLQAWHLRNNHDAGVFELDDAVRAEVAALQNPTGNARLDNLQARLNLLEKMVGQAAQQTAGAADHTPDQLAARNVFTAPEWLFCGLDGRQGGNAGSGGALTEGEMRKVTEELVAMSGRHPGMTIIPGTILWNAPVTPTPASNGRPRPMDTVFNCSPIVANGQLQHMSYKQKEGMDPKMAAKGLPGQDGAKGAYLPPSPNNEFRERLQHFSNDSENHGVDVSAAQAQFQRVAGPGRDLPKWEAALRGLPVPAENWQQQFGPSGHTQANNHLFTVGDRTFALDICADHSPFVKGAKNEALNVGADPLRQRVALEQGVDAHFVISSGSSLSGGSNYVKHGGAYAANDLSEGRAQFLEMDAQMKGGILYRPVPEEGKPGCAVQCRLTPSGPAVPMMGGAVGLDGGPAIIAVEDDDRSEVIADDLSDVDDDKKEVIVHGNEAEEGIAVGGDDEELPAENQHNVAAASGISMASIKGSKTAHGAGQGLD